MTMRRGACVGVCVPLRVWARERARACELVCFCVHPGCACVHAWAACQVSSFDQSSSPLDMTTGNREARCNARSMLQRTARLGAMAMRNGRPLVRTWRLQRFAHIYPCTCLFLSTMSGYIYMAPPAWSGRHQ
jgi:hypothetical protein